jgi:hypothetical protein
LGYFLFRCFRFEPFLFSFSLAKFICGYFQTIKQHYLKFQVPNFCFKEKIQSFSCFKALHKHFYDFKFLKVEQHFVVLILVVPDAIVYFAPSNTSYSSPLFASDIIVVDKGYRIESSRVNLQIV